MPWLPAEAVAVVGSHRGAMWRLSPNRPKSLSPDGRWLARYTDGGTLVLYDAATLLPRWWWRPSTPFAMAFSPDGKRLAVSVTGQGPHGVRLLDMLAYLESIQIQPEPEAKPKS